MVNKRLLEVEFRFHNDNFRHGCHRAGTEIQGKLNHFKAWEKSEILLRVREKLHLWKKSGKSKILSNYEVVHPVMALFKMKDREPFLFRCWLCTSVEKLTDSWPLYPFLYNTSWSWFVNKIIHFLYLLF